MGVTAVHKDPQAKTMTVVSDYDASIDAVWQLWSDPRKLERWWGPPTYPSTFVDHDLSVGSRVTYYMTGPNGEKPQGWWRVLAVDPPRSLEIEDGFSDDSGEPDPNMPVMIMRLTLAERAGGGTTMTIATSFPSTEAMEKLLEMGMEEGIVAAIGQIDALLG